MPEHRIIITYVAKDEGSRKKPLVIIDEGRFGKIHRVSRIAKDKPFYEITMFSEDDPEEILTILREPSEGGVFVLLMTADEHEIFRHKKYYSVISGVKKKK